MKVVEVAVIGGGQAGLATSWHLQRAGIEHVVFEAETVCHQWADARWDNFTLVTPNWHCQLPGYRYQGADPDGFMTKDEIVGWLEGYVEMLRPPVLEHTKVTSLSEGPEGGFDLTTDSAESEQHWHADHVVVATGGYHHPIRPRWAEALDSGIVQLDSANYRSPAQLPEGEVLVVGSGQSGTQIAEDLHLAGRHVHLALGDAPRVARTYRGKDAMTWLAEMGLYDTPVQQYPGGLAAREKTNHYVTGREGGRDIDLRKFALEGMRLYGLCDAGRGEQITFAPTLRESLDAADRVYNSICTDIDKHIVERGIQAPPGEHYQSVWEPPFEPRELDLGAEGVTSIVWAIGYRADYSWIGSGVFDGAGRPAHHRGVTSTPGLYFLGLPWQHTWGSGRLLGIAPDAGFVVGEIEDARAQVDAVSA